jgi:glycosyltransferase involved in cell wall biosynthesis
MGQGSSGQATAQVSAAIVTFNAEQHLEECLSALAWTDEIVLMDLGSTDRTLEIAQSFHCHIVKHEWVPIAEFVLNHVIDYCRYEWILVIDPDEVVPAALAEQLKRIASSNTADVVSIARKNYFFGRWLEHSGRGHDRHLRFFRKGTIEYKPYVHTPAEMNGKLIELPEEEGYWIIHYNYDTVSQYLEKLNRYTSLEIEKPDYAVAGGIVDIVRAPFRELRSRFFDGKAFEDGLQGFADSELMACYRLVTGIKWIEKQQWANTEPHALLTMTRQGILLGMWDLLQAMETNAESSWLRTCYRILRGCVALVLRVRAY